VNVKDVLGHHAHLKQVPSCLREDATYHTQQQPVMSAALSVDVIGVTIDHHITVELHVAKECMSGVNHTAAK
jgi:hypothetical protein